MSRVRGKDTSLERRLRRELQKTGLRFRKHLGNLPGRPDAVFSGPQVAVFIDGDFWHGYRFPSWKKTLMPFWQAKIELTRKRDRRNFNRLRRLGWKVIRIWEHQIDNDIDHCITRIAAAVKARTE